MRFLPITTQSQRFSIPQASEEPARCEAHLIGGRSAPFDWCGSLRDHSLGATGSGQAVGPYRCARGDQTMKPHGHRFYAFSLDAVEDPLDAGPPGSTSIDPLTRSGSLEACDDTTYTVAGTVGLR